MVSHLRPIGLNVLGYQSHLLMLQRCHPVCVSLRVIRSLPGSRLRLFFSMQVQHPYTSSILTLSTREARIKEIIRSRIELTIYKLLGQRVCVCVFFPSILDIKFVGRTSRGHTEGRSHRISHPPSFCGACLYFSREKDSAIPFPRRQ